MKNQKLHKIQSFKKYILLFFVAFALFPCGLKNILIENTLGTSYSKTLHINKTTNTTCTFTTVEKTTNNIIILNKKIKTISLVVFTNTLFENKITIYLRKFASSFKDATFPALFIKYLKMRLDVISFT